MQIPTHNLEANTFLGVTAHLVDFVHRSQTRTTAAMDLFLGSTPGAPLCLCLVAVASCPRLQTHSFVPIFFWSLLPSLPFPETVSLALTVLVFFFAFLFPGTIVEAE